MVWVLTVYFFWTVSMGGFKGNIYRKALLLHPRYRSFLYILTVTNSGTVYSVSILFLWCEEQSSPYDWAVYCMWSSDQGLSKPHFSDVGATGLPKADRTGHSDPYVVVQARTSRTDRPWGWCWSLGMTGSNMASNWKSHIYWLSYYSNFHLWGIFHCHVLWPKG